MNRWCKRVLLSVALVIGVVLVGFTGALATATESVNATTDPGLISVPNAYSFVPTDLIFADTTVGVFLTRTTKLDAVYHGSVSAEEIVNNNGLDSFNPTYTAMVKHNDVWEDVPVNALGQCEGPFRIDSAYDIEQSDKMSIGWYLDADAPAAVYGIKCIYDDPETPEQHESIFNVVYTDVWTYLTTVDNNGANQVTNFFGGNNRTLTVQVSFNDGATTPTLEPINQEIDDSGVYYGAIRNNEIIALDTLQFTLKTISGETYGGEISIQRIPNTNLVTLLFTEDLANDTYLLQVSSAVDNQIYGQLVINNSGGAAGINLSQIWIFFVVAGGFLVLAAAITFGLPFIVVRINVHRVEKESARIARMKNPEAYAAKSGTLFQRLQKKLQKLGKRKGNAAATEEEKPQAEAAPVYKPKFTDMLRERRENRDFVQKGGKTKSAASANSQNNATNTAASFAFLQDDDDDEIASLHEEKEEVSTIETGSYVQDGVTFAKLDSLQDENDENGANGQ